MTKTKKKSTTPTADAEAPLLFRQGDVLLRGVAEVPPDAMPIAREKDACVLAHGELTGHAHRVVERQAEMTRGAAGVYLTVPVQALLEHEEHATITLPPGRYQQFHQVEDWGDEVRNVAD